MNEFLRTILMLPRQASTLANDLDYLHYFVITVTMLGAAAVALFTLGFIAYFRRSAHHGKNVPPDRHRFHTRGGLPIWLEFSFIGGLIALFVLWWVIGFRQYVRFQEPPDGAMKVYVTGKQWMWSFAYPSGGGSNGVLYVPVGQPVKLVMTSRDVIHSFFVPAFRVKQDVIPGRSTSIWFTVEEPGRYPILCTEYCGKGHSTMRGEVVALAAPDYEQQVEGLRQADVAEPEIPNPSVVGQTAPEDPLSLARVGEQVAADKGCLRCHTVDGTPHIGPTWAGLYTAEITLQSGETIVANDAYLTESMMDPMAKVHAGFKPVMPSYQGRLTAAQTGALVEFIRSLRDAPRELDRDPLPEPVQGDVPIIQPVLPPAFRDPGQTDQPQGGDAGAAPKGTP